MGPPKGAVGGPPPPPVGHQPPGGGAGNKRAMEVGEAGALRLVTEPLVTEAGWLLPLALMGLPLVLVAVGWQWPLGEKHLGLLLWAGWLLPELLYFSFTTGLFHSYYLIMLGPPLAALVGATSFPYLFYHGNEWPTPDAASVSANSREMKPDPWSL